MNKTKTQNDVLRVGIIGAGLQGGRRAPVLKQFSDNKLVMVADIRLEAAQKLAEINGGVATQRWKEVVESPDIDLVIVCTPPDLHAAMSIAAMDHGKHVLCEKPLSLTVEEGKDMLAASQANSVTLKCGFNHRHHPGINKARQWIDSGAIGRCM